ncbi:MAG TPA: ceramidase domain-containing protein [Ilumatobacter sp.]|nr:ceramidase domain-containing protein [Ilumatobacter sp.]
MGGSDCEHIGQGLLGQPVNAVSTLAYVIVAVLLLWRVLGVRPRASLTIYAVIVAGIGFGSVMFHGPMPSWGRFAHDLTIAAVLAFVIAFDASLVRAATVRMTLVIFAALVGVSAVVLVVSPDASNAVVAVFVGGAAGAELVVIRLASSRTTAPTPVWILGAAVLIVGAVLNGLGRTDAPFCDPDSVVQFHALWHALTAFVLWLYGTAVLGARAQARPKIRA